MPLLRILFPKWAERRRIAKLAKQAQPKAYKDARRMCAAQGVKAIAFYYDVGVQPCGKADCDVYECAVAESYARASYRPEAFEAARDGALAGFADYALSRWWPQ